MTALDRWRLGRVLLVCLVCVAAVGGLGSGVVAQSTNETTNETVQHERPESAGESGDVEQLQRWLEGRLNARLGESTVALSEGEYEQARSMLGEDYEGRLGQYVDVAGETGSGTEAGETYREVGQSQLELANQAQQFEAASERYREARENGNTSGARAAAREMNRIGNRIVESGSNTTQGYETIANRTGADTSDEQAVVRNLTENVTERQQAVRQATFVETTITVTDATRSISYTDPLALTGRLAQENGTALANRSVTVTVAGRPRSVTTDGEGRFTLSYRPRTLRLSADSIQVAYLPRQASVYLGSNASVPVDVAQVEPTLRVRNHTARTAFGESAGATAVLTVDGEPVEAIPVVAAVDGRRIALGNTSEDGSVRLTGTLPATVPAGDQQLRTSLRLDDRAIGPATETRPVTVEPTATALNVTGDRRENEARLTGRLLTTDGRPVEGQQVRISRAGTTVTTVETGSNGSYAATVPLTPGGGELAGRVQVAVRFDGAGTSLEPARATTVFGEPPSEGRFAFLWDLLPTDGPWAAVAGVALAAGPWPTLAIVALVVLGVGGTIAWRRRSGEADEDPDRPDPTPTATPEAGTTDESLSAIERAETFLERGAAGAAVRAAYAAVRERYATAEGPATHWELFDQAQSLDGDDRSAFERVTTAYEREAFASGSVDEGGARAAVDAAGELLERGQ